MSFFKNGLFFLLTLIFGMQGVFAWTDHTLGTYAALENMPELKNSKPVRVESLEDFLKKEGEGLAKFLKEQEDFARKNIPDYPPRPDSIQFDPKDQKNIRKNFLQALRLNPTVKLGFYIQELPGVNIPGSEKFPPADLSIFKDIAFFSRLNFRSIKLNAQVSPIQVLATGADEPDYGNDIGLYQDNNTDHGKKYSLRTQSFGDQRFEYGSQAPAHMGFYHEAGVVYTLAAFLKRTLPEYRLYQCLSLAKFAFKTGHPYWGYRFTGWGLHYVGDLTQPYHSTVVPRVGVLKMIWINTIAMLGFDNAKKAIIKRVADRHTAIEHYQYELFESIFRKKQMDNPMLKAFSDLSSDASYGEYDQKYMKDKITKESNSRANGLDEKIEKWEPIFKFIDDKVRFEEVPDKSQARDNVDQYMIALMKSFGAHTRNYVRAALK